MRRFCPQLPEISDPAMFMVVMTAHMTKFNVDVLLPSVTGVKGPTLLLQPVLPAPITCIACVCGCLVGYVQVALDVKIASGSHILFTSVSGVIIMQEILPHPGLQSTFNRRHASKDVCLFVLTLAICNLQTSAGQTDFY